MFLFETSQVALKMLELAVAAAISAKKLTVLQN